jgi:hypothetical protein
MPTGGSVSAILSEQADEVLVGLRETLVRRVREVRADLAQAESELTVVEQAIAVRARREARESSSDVDAERDRERDGRFQGIPRQTILSVAEKVHYPITPARVVKAFAERGQNVNTEQIRVALNRIAKDGNLSKVGPSVFAVPGSLSAVDANSGPFRDSGTPETQDSSDSQRLEELASGQ